MLDQKRSAQLATLRAQVEGQPIIIRTALLRLSAGEDISDLASTDYLSTLTTSRSPDWHRSSEAIERANILAKIEAARTQHPGQILVLQGAPGSGKSTLLNWLASDPAWRQRFPDGIRFLSQSEAMPTAITTQDQLEPLPAHSAQIIERLQLRRGQRLLLCLDNWTNSELAHDLAAYLSSESVIIAATRSAIVAHALSSISDCQIEVKGYTPEEAEQYFQRFCDQHQRRVTEDDRANFETMLDLMRANPLGLRIALTHMLWRGWAEVIRQLTALPAEPAAAATNDLYQPLRMAYDLLGPGLQRAFRQLGALPLLENYDRATFVALWPQIDLAYIDLYLDVLTTDASFIVASNSNWKIHGSVLNFARSLTNTQAEDDNRENWLQRALASQTYQTAYQEFLRRSPRWTLRGLIKLERATHRSFQESVWRRAWRNVAQPTYVSDWVVAQDFVPHFTATEYLIAHRLRSQEVRLHRAIQIGLLINVVMVFPALLLSAFDQWSSELITRWLPVYLLLLYMTFGLDISLGIYTWLVGLSYKMNWLQWWLAIQQRQTSEPQIGS